MSLIKSIDQARLPKHIAIIMDGNGRWARQQGQLRTFGHQHGVQPVKEISEACASLGIPYLTLYAFSTENWNRPQDEIDALMEILVKTIHSEIDSLNKNQIRLQTIGDTNKLPLHCQKELSQAMEQTANNNRLTLNLALSYSSRWEITEAVKKIIIDIKNNKLTETDVNEKLISSYLSTHNLPDPELLIRTSGEHRISNFLLWQIAYTEFYFSPKLWPDFDKEDLYAAIINYQKRERRFGKTSDQLI